MGNSLHEGHRARLRARFEETGLAGFQPHEILEMLLFYAIPRRDTNELAHRLMDTFGSLQEGILLLIVDHFHGGRIVDLGVLLDVLQLGIVSKGQEHQENDGQNGAGADEGSAAAALALAAVGNTAEQGQHEQGQNIVQGHDDTGCGLAEAELAGQGHGNGHIVNLPEGADQEKRKADKNGTLGIELHGVSSSLYVC